MHAPAAGHLAPFGRYTSETRSWRLLVICFDAPAREAGVCRTAKADHRAEAVILIPQIGRSCGWPCALMCGSSGRLQFMRVKGPVSEGVFKDSHLPMQGWLDNPT